MPEITTLPLKRPAEDAEIQLRAKKRTTPRTSPRHGACPPGSSVSKAPAATKVKAARQKKGNRTIPRDSVVTGDDKPGSDDRPTPVAVRARNNREKAGREDSDPDESDQPAPRPAPRTPRATPPQKIPSAMARNNQETAVHEDSDPEDSVQPAPRPSPRTPRAAAPQKIPSARARNNREAAAHEDSDPEDSVQPAPRPAPRTPRAAAPQNIQSAPSSNNSSGQRMSNAQNPIATVGRNDPTRNTSPIAPRNSQPARGPRSTVPPLARNSRPTGNADHQSRTPQQGGGRLNHMFVKAQLRMDGLDEDMKTMKKDVFDLRGEVAEVKGGMNSISSLLNEMNGKMTQALTDGSDSTGIRQSSPMKGAIVKPMAKYERLMVHRVPFRELAFDAYVLSRCTVSSLFADIAGRCQNAMLGPAGLKEVVHATFFSLKRTDTKKVYEATPGKVASALRQRILLNVLRQARLDTFRRFRTPTVANQDSNIYHSEGGLAAADAGRPLKPEWLRNSTNGGINYITQEHLKTSQGHQESSSSEKSSYQRRLHIAAGGSPSRSDDGEFAMSFLYSSLLTTLNASRRNGPLEFFQRLGYLFVDWTPYKNCRVTSDHLKMSWVVDFKSARPCEKEDVPKAISVSACDPAASEKNRDVYKNFVEEREEMQIVVEHDVLVRLKGKENDVRNHIGVDARKWTRVISLIDVAAHFMRSACSFGRGGSIHEILVYNSQSVLALYNIAWVFREMIASRNDPCVQPPSSSPHPASPSEAPPFHSPLGLSADIEELFKMLTPSASMIDRALLRVTCAVPEETFDAENVDPDRNTDASNSAGHDGYGDGVGAQMRDDTAGAEEDDEDWELGDM